MIRLLLERGDPKRLLIVKERFYVAFDPQTRSFVQQWRGSEREPANGKRRNVTLTVKQASVSAYHWTVPEYNSTNTFVLQPSNTELNMFQPWWQRLFTSGNASPAIGHKTRRRNHLARPHLEHLENRVTPSAVNLTAAVKGTTLMLTEKSAVGISGGSGISISESGAVPGMFTVQLPQGDTINGQVTQMGFGFFATPTKDLGNGRTVASPGITSVVVTLGSGTDTVTFGGTLDLPGNITITGTGGDKTISAGGDVGSLSIILTGKGTETSTFTGLNVAGAATIAHTGTGDTTLTVSNGTNAADNWGSLTVTNGSGFDTIAVGDTNFTGNVTINNGAGGSFSNISATNDQNLTTIGGNLTITTTSGMSESELYDYNVHGNVTINTGIGAAGQENYVGLEDIKSFPNSGVPVINGNVTVIGDSTTGGTLDVVSGTDIVDPNGPGTASDLPLTILGNLTVLANGPASGTGTVLVDLNDLSVADGSTMIITGASTTATVDAQAGTGLTSDYKNVTLSLNGTGDVVNIQDHAGTIKLTGNLTVQLNAGTNSTINAGADAGNDAGVANAQLFLYGKTTITAKKAGNKLFGAPGKVVNNDILFVTEPSISSNITLA
jgi:hypothetical protein